MRCRLRPSNSMPRRKHILRTAILVALVTALLIAVGDQYSAFAFASEEVHFTSASVPPTPFQTKRAQAKGIELKPKPGIPLTGKLSKPEGAGPYPAVVLFHDCFGVRPYQDDWAMELVKWGYVALQVDSFGPRDIEETCTNLREAFFAGVGGNNVVDAYGALSYLRGQPFVDEDHVAIMGWGFSPVLSAVVRDGQQRYFDERFRAAIALYPDCDDMISGDFYLPLLILIGASDDWTLSAECERTAAASKKLPNRVVLHVYPDAHHGFDDSDLHEPWYQENVQNVFKTPPRGATLSYNAAAHRDAQEQARVFLAEHLK